MPDTRQCPNCGTVNDTGNALCENCKTPLTAYGGQLTGEIYQGKLAAQVDALDRRPPIVVVMALFSILFALFWPIATMIGRFSARTHEGDGAYIATAVNTFANILLAIVLIPLALALFGLAAATWTQRTWTWTANAVALVLLGLIGVYKILHHGYLLGLFCLAVAGALAYFWYRPQTRAWFGLS